MGDQNHLVGNSDESSRIESLSNRINELVTEIKDYYESDDNAYPYIRSYTVLISEKVTEEEFGDRVGEVRSEVGSRINELKKIESQQYQRGLNIEM